MLRKLEYLCLVGSLGLIGADRIDLAAGHLPFILNPFLVLAPLTLLIHLMTHGPEFRFIIPLTPEIRRQKFFFVGLIVFLLFAIASVPFGLDPTRGIVAVCDLLLVVFLSYYILLRVLTERERDRLITHSVTFALLAYLVFCVGEYIAWRLGFFTDVTRSGTWIESTFTPSSIWNIVPQLSGTTYDPNRSGFILTMYLVLIDTFLPRSRYTRLFHWTIASLVFLSFSRSGFLCWLAYSVVSRGFWSNLSRKRVYITLLVIVIASTTLYRMYADEVDEIANSWHVADVISSKLSMAPGSSGESHVLLIERGIQTWQTSTKTILFGIGFAAAPHVLGDFFGDDKHGNFHDLYITALAEMGMPAFVAIVFLLVYPIFGRSGTLSAIAAILIFNVSYQVIMEPFFWLSLALLWAYKRRGIAA